MSYKAQKEAGECHIKIPVITFDSPEEEKQGVEGGEEEAGSEDEPTPKHQPTASQSEEFHLCRETTTSESTTLECPDPDQELLGVQTTDDSTPSPQLTNDNSSSGIDVHSHPDDTDPLDTNVDSQGFLRLPPALGRYGPGGRTHIRGLSMDSGKDAVLLSDRSHNTVCWQFSSVAISSYLRPSVHSYKHLSLHQTTMTSSKSDLEAKEGQIPNESNFLEFVSLLGSLSARGGGASSTQEDEGQERKEEVGAAEGGEAQQEGLFLYFHLLHLHVL